MMPINDPRLAASLRCSRCGGALGTSGPLCGDCLSLMPEWDLRGATALDAIKLLDSDTPDTILGKLEIAIGIMGTALRGAQSEMEAKVLTERERCAKIVEAGRHGHWDDPPAECIAIAAKIREGK